MALVPKTIRTLSWSILLSSVLVACVDQEKSSNSSSSPNSNPRKPQVSNPQPRPCSGGKVLEVLRNGKTAISLSREVEGDIISWDVLSGTMLGHMYYPASYLSVSPDGRFLLRKISFKKFQLIQIGKGNGKSRVININSVHEPEVDFSFDSKYLLIKNTPLTTNLIDQVIIYDIENHRYLTSVELRDIKYYSLTRDTQFIFIAQDDGVNKVITKFESMSRRRLWQIALPKFQRLSVMDVGDNALIAKSGSKFYVFDLESGKKNYELSSLNYYGLSAQGNFGIFSQSVDKISIRNLQSGEEVYQLNVPADVYLSSCRLEEEKRVMVCRHKTEHHKIVVWDLAASVTASSCI